MVSCPVFGRMFKNARTLAVIVVSDFCPVVEFSRERSGCGGGAERTMAGVVCTLVQVPLAGRVFAEGGVGMGAWVRRKVQGKNEAIRRT